jgi:hydroxylamine reductase (hybrid-cluster protein)
MFSRLAVRALTRRAGVSAGISSSSLATTISRSAAPALLSSTYLTNRMNILQSSSSSFSTKPAEVSNPDMFCRQCEQTKDHYACTTVGVCGKTAETAVVQDALLHQVKSLSLWCVAAREAGATAEQLHDANVYTLKAMFSTLTNVNFSEDRIHAYCLEGEAVKDKVKQLVSDLGGTAPTGHVADVNMADIDAVALEALGMSVSIPVRKLAMNHDDSFSLNEVATYGTKVSSSTILCT